MDDTIMGDIHKIQEGLKQQGELMTRIVELNERQVASNDKLNDHIIRTDHRMDKSDERHEKLNERVVANNAQILKWSGAVAALLTCSGIVFAAIRLLP